MEMVVLPGHLNFIKKLSNLWILLLLVVFIKSTNCQNIQEHQEQEPNADQNQQGKASVLVHYTYSPLHLTFLAKIEKQIYETLGEYETELLERLQIIQRFRQDYEDSISKALPNLDPNADEWHRAGFLASHPFMIHRMIRRYSVDLRDFYVHISKGLENAVWQLFENLRGDYEWPTLHDLSDTFQLLLRLQETYDFDVEQFTSGVIKGIKTPSRLAAKNCLEVVDTALTKGDTLAAGEWLKVAREKVAFQGDISTSLEILTDYWERTIRMHGKTWNIDDFSTPDIFHEARSSLKRVYEDQKFDRTFDNRQTNYKALCRGEDLLTATERSKLYCYFETKKNPRFIIDPQRVEVHNLNPELIEVHNFFGDQIVRDFSSKSLTPLMQSSEHWTAKPLGFLDTKTTSPAWIYDTTDEMFRLARKMELFLGLGILIPGGSEPFHMSGFSVGGHYDPCIDCEAWENEQYREAIGERMTTVQLMLEDVESGGETVFTQLGVKIKPTKGSALVFNNVLKNGGLDLNMLHGSCPVLLGHKWVASVFIHENGNFLNRKCSKNRLE